MSHQQPLSDFQSWRGSLSNLILVFSVESVILLPSFFGVYWLFQKYHFGFFAGAILFYFFITVGTFLVLAVVRRLFPIREGVYSDQDNPITFRSWNLHEFLCITNLSLFYDNSLVPILLKSGFYQLLGAKIEGAVAIAGQLRDPYLISMEDNVIVGSNTLLIPREMSLVSRNTKIPPNEIWGSNPAVKIKNKPKPEDNPA